MSNRIVGRFYFKMTANGNLLGEYSNRHPSSTRSYAEAATRVPSTDEDKAKGDNPTAHWRWVGSYVSTWCEAPDDNCEYATLRIDPKTGTSGLFIVVWSRNGAPIFGGEAMLCDDMLVGDYTNG